MWSFSTREISITIWIALLAIFLVTKKEIRDSVKGLITAFFNKGILITFSLMFIYIFFCLCMLSSLGLFEMSQIKEVVIWFFTVAFVYFLNAPNYLKLDTQFKKVIFDSLKVIALVEIITATYTFHIIVELIFVPLTVLLAAVQVYIEYKNSEEYKDTKKLVDFLLNSIGTFIIIYCTYKLITNFSEFANKDNLLEFIVPIILSLLLIPFIFIISLFMNYEHHFIGLSSFFEDKRLLKYVKYKVLINFRTRIELLKRWHQSLLLYNIKSKEDVDNSINDLFKRIKVEKNPPKINLADGWCPFASKDFLLEYGINTGYYNKNYRFNTWSANSNFIKLSSGALSNNVSYYIRGNENFVTELQLTLDVYDLNQEKSCLKDYGEIAIKLCRYSIGKSVTKQIQNLISNKRDKQFTINKYTIIINFNSWITNNLYNIDFIIRHYNHTQEY